MKKVYLAVACFLLQGFLSAQGSLTYINQLGAKQIATYADGLYFMVIVLNRAPGNFSKNKAAIQRRVKSVDEIKLKPSDPLNRGAIALLISSYLNLSDSLMYNIFKNQTYAVQACIAAGIMDANCSSNDILSGEDLIEIMDKVSLHKGGGR